MAVVFQQLQSPLHITGLACREGECQPCFTFIFKYQRRFYDSESNRIISGPQINIYKRPLTASAAVFMKRKSEPCVPALLS